MAQRILGLVLQMLGSAEHLAAVRKKLYVSAPAMTRRPEPGDLSSLGQVVFAGLRLSDPGAILDVSFNQDTWLASVEPVDFDGDSRVDIAMSANFGEDSVILLNGGNDGFTSHREHLDAAFAGEGLDQEPFAGTSNRLLVQTSDSLAEEGVARLGLRSGFTHNACAADVDGDGDIDLLTTDLNAENENSVILSVNDGAGYFADVLVEVPSKLIK